MIYVLYIIQITHIICYNKMLIIYRMSSRESHLSNIHLNMAWLCAYIPPASLLCCKEYMWWNIEALYFIHLFWEEYLEFYNRPQFQIIIVELLKRGSFPSFHYLPLFICKQGWHLFIRACPRKRASHHLQVKQLDALTEEVKADWYDNNIIDGMWLLPAVSDSPSFAVCSLRR